MIQILTGKRSFSVPMQILPGDVLTRTVFQLGSLSDVRDTWAATLPGTFPFTLVGSIENVNIQNTNIYSHSLVNCSVLSSPVSDGESVFGFALDPVPLTSASFKVRILTAR